LFVVIVSVELKVGVPDIGLKLQVVPVGHPEQLHDTVCVVPLTNVAVVVKVVDPPATTIRVGGEAETLNSKVGDGGPTISCTVVEWEPWMHGPVPVMVKVYVPFGVLGDVVTFSVDVNVGLPDGGLKLEVAPLGKPETLRETV